MIIGFTGTQIGMTARQAIRLYEVIKQLSLEEGITEAHHGDCIGADDEFHFILREYFASVRISIHPCTIKDKRAGNSAEHVFPVKPPLDRNRYIDDVISVLLAAPRTMCEEQRSGTWMTVRYLLKTYPEKRLIIVYPDGSVAR
jgi:hypothetical protein